MLTPLQKPITLATKSVFLSWSQLLPKMLSKTVYNISIKMLNFTLSLPLLIFWTFIFWVISFIRFYNNAILLMSSLNFISPLLYYLLKALFKLTHGGQSGNLWIVIYAPLLRYNWAFKEVGLLFQHNFECPLISILCFSWGFPLITGKAYKWEIYLRD